MLAFLWKALHETAGKGKADYESTTRFAVFGCGDAGYDGAGFVAGDAR